MTMTRGSLQLFYDNIRRKEILHDNWEIDAKNMIGPKLYNVETSEKKMEDIAGWTTPPAFAEKSEGAPIPTVNVAPIPNVRFTHKTFAQSQIWTREAQMDDYQDQVHNDTKILKGISEAARDTKEAYAASVFNLGFTSGATQGAGFMGGYGSGDGQILFYASHPYANGTTGANTPSAASQLSETSLEAMMILMASTKDPGGNRKIGQSLLSGNKILLHNQKNARIADQLISSTLTPGSANNATNYFKGKFEPVTWNYLTNDDAWFIVCEKKKNFLYWFDREIFDSRPWAMENADTAFQAFTRFSVGWAYWSGVYGNQGA